MNESYIIVILPLLRRNKDLGLNGHLITHWLIEICFRLRILIRVKKNLEIVQSVKSYFAKLNKGLGTLIHIHSSYTFHWVTLTHIQKVTLALTGCAKNIAMKCFVFI